MSVAVAVRLLLLALITLMASTRCCAGGCAVDVDVDVADGVVVTSPCLPMPPVLMIVAPVPAATFFFAKGLPRLAPAFLPRLLKGL